MTSNPLVKLHDLGQSIWVDYIGKSALSSGEFRKMIDDDHVTGVTSNPTIFEQSIVETTDYDEMIRQASLEGRSTKEIYEILTITDIQDAADLFLDNYQSSKGTDGFVSMEVSPHLAHDTEGTIEEARRLWKKIARSNLLIKVPGTREGIPAIKHLIAEGINVNITLLFGLERYDEVIEAYLSGLESRMKRDLPINEITSVASFFLSRIDTKADPVLPENARGHTAIACAKLAYEKYKSAFTQDRFAKLKAHGARPQKLLWASTSTKNPQWSDVKYVEALIGPNTIDTIPLKTLNAYRDHGRPENRLESGLNEAKAVLENLRQNNIDLHALTQQLEDEGVQKFNEAFDKLMAALEVKRMNAAFSNEKITLTPQGLAAKKMAALNTDKTWERLWNKDSGLWPSDKPEAVAKAMGWLHSAEKMNASISEFKNFAREVKSAGFEHVVHMGMGGSSLAPLVFARTFSAREGLPLTILDTTHPTTIKSIEKSIPLEKTLFIVASKSGTTAEPLAFRDYFYNKVRQAKREKAGENFVAITDPGTPLVKQSQEQGFRKIFYGDPEIGGRYSALSPFGLVPAALMGVNIDDLLKRTIVAAHSAQTPGCTAFVLGAAMGELALHKKDKVTLLVDSPLESLGLWLEQLLAESTGKIGKGLIPVAGEPLGAAKNYSDDRFFIHLTTGHSKNTRLSHLIAELKKTGHPVAEIHIDDRLDLGREFFQWELATALAGSILGVNAFDQPNVEESKQNTAKLLAKWEKSGPEEETPVLKENSLEFYGDPTTNPGVLRGSVLFINFLREAVQGDYLALLAYLPETPATFETLQIIRQELRDRLKAATTLGYGPRYLHSTGQLHKGGPNTGLFLQLTAQTNDDLPIPGKPYTFSVFNRAQSQGDLEALRKHGRRALRVHFRQGVEKGLEDLQRIIAAALEAP